MNATENDGNSILCLAAGYRHIELVELLISSGANINAINANGLTALTIAIQNYWFKGSNVIAKQLVQACKEVPQGNIPNCFVYSPWSYRLGDKLNKRALDLLITIDGVDLSETGDDGSTLLHNLVQLRYYQSATFLVQKGVSPSLKDAKGRTPAHYLAKLGGYEDEDENDDEEEDVEKDEEEDMEKDEEEEGKTNDELVVLSRAEWKLLQVLLLKGAKLQDEDNHGVTVSELLKERLPVSLQLASLLNVGY